MHLIIYIDNLFRRYEHCKWSRKQAELFTAQQAALLQSSEPRAMSPRSLQEAITDILRDNPDYADAVSIIHNIYMYH